MEKTLEQWPKSPHNNARDIMRKKLVKMRDYPSEVRASELEDKFGIISDWLDADYGEGPKYEEQNG